MKTFISYAFLALAIALPQLCSANENDNNEEEVVQVSLSENGALVGHVFAMMEDEEAPIAGKVTLTSEGQTVSTLQTDATGNFSFKDIQPGKYNMIGDAGSYVGNKVIEVTPFDAELEETEEYTAIPLMVAPSYSPQVFESYGSAPVETFAAAGATEYVGGYTVGGGCSSCQAAPVSSCSSCGSGVSSCGGGCGGCGGGCSGGFGGGGLGRGGIGGRGLNFRRLALIGGTVGLAVGIGTSSSSPDE